jgi:hypothetical protein
MVARKENGIYVVSDSFDVNRYEFDGTADQLKANIDLVVEKASAMGMVGEGFFDMEVGSDYYDGGYELRIKYYFTRVENGKERAAREAAEAEVKAEKSAKRKAAAEKKKLKGDAEYAEFLRLKEKFKEIET